MRLEDVQLSIRPRTILECFDLAFLFCSRHPVGLFLTASIGVLPLASFNWWVADISEMNEYAVYLLIAMELPWATMFVTLYLGQATFSQRLSFRRMLNDGARAVPGLLLFQGMLRGICLVMIVLVPVVFLGMYYVNEIILLEKAPVSRIWNRRTAINTQIMGRIVAMRIMEFFVLLFGTMGLASLIRAVSSLWQDRMDAFRWMLFEEESDAGFLISMDWETQAAFWIVIVFLTVFRFISYLDCRIRREGWDVELKLRSQAALYQQREAAE